MKAAVQFILGGYKRWISPMLPQACRFVPTCSEYAIEAVERHGSWRGTYLAIWRLLRCQPFARAGYDPVPPVTRTTQHCCDHVGSASFGGSREPISRNY
jgi:uncharacterized protein